MMSIKQAYMVPAIRSALAEMNGKPVGAWVQTAQARQRLLEALPRREDREFSVDQLIEDAYVVVCADSSSSGLYSRRVRSAAAFPRTDRGHK